MKKTFGIVIALIGVAVTTIALGANENPIIVLRQRLMAADGQAAALAVAMIRGQIAFDPIMAATVATIISHANSVVPDLFPDGSDKGSGVDGKPTAASPDVFKDKAGFKALALKMAADAKAAADAAPQGKDAFAKAFVTVGQNCQNCHEKYRQSL
jgi:cytochrome c556